MGNRYGTHSFKRRHLSILVSLACAGACSPLMAQQEGENAPSETTMNAVVVSANRSNSGVDDVSATITVVGADEIEKNHATNLQDTLQYEADVSVSFKPYRGSGGSFSGKAGNEGVNIRGLEGNQVLMQVDGVRLPAAYNYQVMGFGRGDYIDPEAFKQVEILRGASSTSYGSDGLAGAVSFVTKDPSDLLRKDKGNVQGSLKLAYSSVIEGWTLVPTVAARGEQFEGMVLASVRRNHEWENQGNNNVEGSLRTKANPQDNKSDYFLGKLVFKANANHSFKLTAEQLDRNTKTNSLSARGASLVGNMLTVDTKDDIKRTLGKLDWQYMNADNPWIQSAKFSIYHQKSESTQYADESRASATGWNTRNRDYAYNDTTWGLSLQAESNFGEHVTHRLVYGVDYSQSDLDMISDGKNYLNGNLVTTGMNAYVTKKFFPDTDYKLLGAFISDEISIGRLNLIPGLRFDRFELTPSKGDPLYEVANNMPTPVKLSDHEVSPRFGVIWKQAPLLNIFGQYAHGFRAPTAADVNGGFANPAQGYAAIGNPNLKPETSNTFELGLRGADNTLSYKVAAFYSKYKDFIAMQQISGSGTPADPGINQSVNYGDVTIKGFDLSASWRFRPNWLLTGSYAHVKGDKKEEGVKSPLETVNPDKLVLGLRYDESGRFGGQAHATMVSKKHRNPNANGYNPSGFGLVDLTAWYQFGRDTTLNVGVFNVFDKKYWLWTDVRDLSATSKIVDAYSQPGRHYAISLKHQF